VMRQGDRGDWYLLIAAGDVDVRDGDQVLGGAHAGEGVGEIAVLRQAPRMASVLARTDVSGYAIDAPTFLCALSGPAATAAAHAVAEARLAVTADVRRAAAARTA
jgi:CRP-like cAMP-binding protein